MKILKEISAKDLLKQLIAHNDFKISLPLLPGFYKPHYMVNKLGLKPGTIIVYMVEQPPRIKKFDIEIASIKSVAAISWDNSKQYINYSVQTIPRTNQTSRVTNVNHQYILCELKNG